MNRETLETLVEMESAAIENLEKAREAAKMVSQYHRLVKQIRIEKAAVIKKMYFSREANQPTLERLSGFKQGTISKIISGVMYG